MFVHISKEIEDKAEFSIIGLQFSILHNKFSTTHLKFGLDLPLKNSQDLGT